MATDPRAVVSIVSGEPTAQAETPARRTQRAGHLLSYGADRGLPAPFVVSVTEHEASAGFRSVAQLADWALWFEATITDRPTAGGQTVMHEAHVDGLRLWCVGVVGQ